MVNNLYCVMKKGKGGDVLNSTLAELLEYIKTHFSAEEKLMKVHEYPERQDGYPLS